MKRIKHLFFLAVLTALCYTPGNLTAQTSEADSLALVDLYNDCGGSAWSGFETWLNGPISTWKDVTVDSASQRVTHVEFSRMTLSGTLPASLGNLTEMSGKIQLNGQEGLTGELPAFVWNWVNVDRFQVKFCGFTSMDVTGMENMVNLTEFNSENTPFAGMVPSAIFELPAMEKLYLHNSEYDALPASVSAISGYTRLYLNGNHLTEIPDMSGIVWGSGAKVRFQDNNLDFADLEPNAGLLADANVEEFRLSPQNAEGSINYTYPKVGEDVKISSSVGGTSNVYTWIYGVDEVVGEEAELTITAFDPAVHSGKYQAQIQNSLVPGLVISTPAVYLFESANIQDSLALVDLHTNNGGETWTGYDTWLNGPLSTWEGVTVDSASQRVVGMNFKDMHLTGELQESLGNLTELAGKIEFRDDSLLTGAIPSFLWRWTKVDRFQMKFSGYTSINTDGIENMVNLTEFNTEGSPIEGMVPGVLFTLPSMVKLYFHNGNYNAVPPEIVNATGLDRLYVNGNGLTELPIMTNVVWKEGAKIRFHENALDFADLEPNVSIAMDTLVEEFRYSPQAKVGDAQDLMPAAGSEVVLDVSVGGSANTYTWVRGEDEVVGEMQTYTIASFDEVIDAGTYFAVVQSPLVPGLDIMSNEIVLNGAAVNMDSLALVDLYNNCGGSEWGESYSDWLVSPLSMWKGVTVDSASGRVVGMDFKDMHLVGELPASLGDMTEMTGKVEFRDDSLLVGAVPSFLWNWTKLERFQMKFSGYTSIDTEGLENMVNLTEFNTEGSPMTGMVPGVIFTLPSMVKLYFHDCEFDALPAELATSSGLDRLYLNGDNFSDLPDMSGIVWAADAKVRVQDNFLTFEDLEYNMPLTMDTLVEQFAFSPQANVGMATTIDLDSGDTLRLAAEVGGTDNIYTWIIGEDSVIDGATEANFQIDSVAVEDSGMYRALVQNNIVVGLDIFTEATEVNVTPPSGIEELPFEGLKVLGNPVGERLVISSAEVISKLSIFNVNGQLVNSSIIDSKEASVEVSDLEAGVYMIMIQNENKYQVIKAIKK